MKKILIIQDINEAGPKLLADNPGYEFEIIKDINTDISIVSDQLPKINPTLIIANDDKNQIINDTDFIGALEGFIVLILICMVAIGLSNLFKKD